MRISDWSSDVCSSDLSAGLGDVLLALAVSVGGEWSQLQISGRRSPRINPSSNEPALRRNLVTMSNVLIGIIGVILFIGLAIAGALFLGPRFQESTNNSSASASVQAVSQIASAANMFEVQEGRIAAVITAVVVDNDDP